MKLTIDLANIFDASSSGSKAIQNLNIGFLVAAGTILLIVIVLTTFISLRFRERPGQIPSRNVSRKKNWEYFMIGGPLALVLFFFFWSLGVSKVIMPPRGDHSPDVVITGHQWWWEASYPAAKVVTANEIHLQAGRPVLLQLNSGDVIHDWWIPAFGPKMDMIPGVDNYLWVNILKPGIYDGACSEFCGEQHAWMRIRVIAQDSTDFQQWLASQAIAADSVSASNKIGAALFSEASCSSCHTIQGTVSRGKQGPDLTHFASRQTMLAGMVSNNDGNVHRWLTDPQCVKPGAKMPRFIFGADSIRLLTSYLENLK